MTAPAWAQTATGTITDTSVAAGAGAKAQITNTGANAKVLAFNSLNRLRFGSPNTTVTAGGGEFRPDYDTCE